MRLFFLFSLILIGCARTVTPHTYTLRSEAVKFQIIDISDLFKDRKVIGSVLIYDEKNNQYYSNDYNLSRTKYCPASTFKIPNTIIGLERGLVQPEYVFKWDGKERSVVAWNSDLNLRDAFQKSCVPCYQELAKKIGETNMNESLQSMKYPGMVVRKDNVSEFWLKEESKISPLEQIDFLRRLNIKAFPLQTNTLSTFKKIALVEQTKKGKLYAKSGMSNDNESKALGGWYVGFIEKENNRIYFATHIEPEAGKEAEMDAFMSSRIDITMKTLNFLYYW